MGARPAARTTGPAALRAAALAVVTALAFLPILGNDFVRWDDDRNFLNNASFSGLSRGTLRWAWTTHLMGVYQPLGWTLMELEYDAWGLDPRGYHAASLILHAVNAVVLWRLTLALLDRVDRAQEATEGRARRMSAAALAAAVYSVHPLRVEVVAWASCQPYLPSTLLAMLAVMAYLRACDGRRGWLVGAWVLYALGLLMKVVPVMLPAVLLVLDVYPLRRIGPGRWVGRGAWGVYAEKLPFLAAALPLMVVAVLARGGDDLRSLDARSEGPVAWLARPLIAPGFYLVKTVVPTGLAAFYPPPTDAIGHVRGMSGAMMAVTVAVTIAALVLRRRLPGLPAAWACYLAAMAPNLGVLRTGRAFLADRYAYVPSMAGAVALAYVLTRLAGRPGAWWKARGVAIVLVVALSALSWRQCLVWRSSESLWTHAYAFAPEDPNINMALGVAKNEAGRPGEARRHFQQALRGNPTETLALVNLGGIALKEGDLAGAEAAWDRALAIDPNEAEALSGLGLVRERQWRLGEAERLQRRALEARPGYTQARNNLALVLMRQGKVKEAADELARIVRDDPSARAHYNLGQVLATLGRHAEALEHAIEAARLDPKNAKAYAAMGQSLAALGREGEAVRAFNVALGLDPGNAEARRGLRELLIRRGG